MQQVRFSQPARIWWSQRRLKFNLILLFSGHLAFIAYTVLMHYLIVPIHKKFEVTWAKAFYFMTGYLCYLVIVNLIYEIARYYDEQKNKKHNEKSRIRLYRYLLWFFVGLPFSLPNMIIFHYFFSLN